MTLTLTIQVQNLRLEVGWVQNEAAIKFQAFHVGV